jgi:hypothetical protein
MKDGASAVGRNIGRHGVPRRNKSSIERGRTTCSLIQSKFNQF